MLKLRVLLVAISTVAAALACENPEPAVVHVRLLTPLASDSSKRGSEFTTVVTAPMSHCGEVLIPSGSHISGTVRRASSVGLGVVRERASMDLDFDTYETPDGRTYPLGARLASIENAREEVNVRGQIKGVLAASNGSRLVRGVWMRPTMDIFPHSLIGLTGASEKLWSGFGMGPQGAAALFAARIILFRFPEPEIILPYGTDLQISVTSLPEDIPAYSQPPVSEVPGALAEWLSRRPFDVTKIDRAPAEDIVNFAFIGTKDQLLQAFDTAGWDLSDRLSSRSFSRTYSAYISIKGYPTAPVSRLYYQGAVPDLVFQKSFNTVAKRHHIRVWSAGTFENNEIWLGAATHDIAVSLKKTSLSLSHKIDPQIDLERSKVVDDLAFTDCVEPPGYVDRIGTVRPGKNSVTTDGRLAVFVLRDCDHTGDDPSPLKRPGRKVEKLARRMVLETRQYLMRDNVYYYGYQGAKRLFKRSSSRPKPEKAVELAAGKPPKRQAGQINTSFSWTAPVTNPLSSSTNTFNSDLMPNSGR